MPSSPPQWITRCCTRTLPRAHLHAVRRCLLRMCSPTWAPPLVNLAHARHWAQICASTPGDRSSELRTPRTTTAPKVATHSMVTEFANSSNKNNKKHDIRLEALAHRDLWQPSYGAHWDLHASPHNTRRRPFTDFVNNNNVTKNNQPKMALNRHRLHLKLSLIAGSGLDCKTNPK